MARTTRRGFLQSAVAAGALFAISGTKASGRVLGANDRVRIGVAGLNSRGGTHVGEWSAMKDVEIAYLIDPDTRTWGGRIKQVEEKTGFKPQGVQDVRKALEDKSLDAISVATPNHWHSLMTIWGCQAGKDVYVEKPCSHNVHEGRIAVETARKYDRIVQHGTQNRGFGQWANLLNIVKSGVYGKLLVSRGLCYKPRGSIGTKAASPAPAEIDFNLWLGPAPEQPHHGNLVHYNWHWFWDFGNGDIGNQGVHQMDVARWLIPGAIWPKSVITMGGRFGYSDQGETPNTQMSIMDYGETQLVFEVRGLKTSDYYKETVGNMLHFEEGTVAGNKFYPNGSTDPQPLAKVEGEAGRKPSGNVFRNFIDCVRSRKREDQDADILEGHYSSGLCHLANISYRLGSPVPFNQKTKAFGDNKEAYATLERLEDHLSSGNGLKLDGLNYQLGPKLEFDAAREKFINTPAADALLNRNYRAPFSVPEKVS